MKKVLYMCLSVAVILSLSSVAMASLYVEGFDSSNAGWLAPTMNSSGGSTYPSATWNSSGGNLDGYISATVSTAADRLFGFEPTDLSPYGDLTGLTLTTDYKIDGTVTGPSGATARFYVGAEVAGIWTYYVSNDVSSWNPNAATDWTTYQVALLSSNFEKWPNQAGSLTFAQVIASPDDIGLVFADGFTSNANLGFSSSGGATISVDNFGTVPIPGAVLLLGSGLIGLLGFRRRLKR